MYKQASQRIKETPAEAYDRGAARRTVGAGETILAGDMNRQMSEGAKQLKEIVRLLTNIDNNTKEKEKPVESGPVTRSMRKMLVRGLKLAECCHNGLSAFWMIGQGKELVIWRFQKQIK